MRIALLALDRYPKTIARGGGDVRLWQSLASLVALGHEVHVIAINPKGELEPAIEKLAHEVITLRTPRPRRFSLPWLASRAFNFETLLLRMPDLVGHRSELARALGRISPDLVWAEEQLTGVLVPDGMPYVVSHVDFFYRLMQVRDTFRTVRRPNALTNNQIKRVELDVCRRARITLVASETHAQELRDHGIRAHYIPVVGPTLPPPDPKRASAGRFFLFGKSNTAMRASRQHLRTELWPLLDNELRKDWHQVGDPPKDAGRDQTWEWLTANFTVHGFVDKLEDLFMLGDASVMPYPIDGSHAKYSIGMGYGLAHIGYAEAMRSTPELVHGENCLMGESSEQVIDVFRQFRADAGMRARLAAGARATYEAKFSFEAQVKNFEQLLRQA